MQLQGHACSGISRGNDSCHHLNNPHIHISARLTHSKNNSIQCITLYHTHTYAYLKFTDLYLNRPAGVDLLLMKAVPLLAMLVLQK